MKQDVEQCDCPYCSSTDDIPTVSIHYVLHRLQDVVTDGDCLVEFMLELEHNANVGKDIS
tara:strand:- start:786 stop:965 length:180 start_codon:yes stop_codon:yes gene_type:complete